MPEAETEDRRERLFAEFRATRSSAARDELAASYLPLADYFARRYADRSVELEDLQQVARLALVKAIDRFDATLGIRFSTFAGRTIDGELKRWFRDKSWAIRVPRSVQENSLAIGSIQASFERENERSPTVDELAEASGLATEDVLEALDARANYRAVALDRPATEGGTTSLGESLVVNDGAFTRSEIRIVVTQLLNTLDERDQEIIRLRYFDELSQDEIADRVGLSQMHVSRLLRRSLQSLQQTMRAGT